LMTVVVLPTPPFWFAQAMTSPTQLPEQYASTCVDSIRKDPYKRPAGYARGVAAIVSMGT
jgi:hypothetical protein